MRWRSAILVTLLASAVCAQAARKVTPDQLTQLLADAAHRSDASVVRALSDLELTAPLPDAQLQQLTAALPGPKSAQSLRALADQAVFLEPATLPATPAPDIATQKRILAQTIHYVARTMPSLPNFLATRATTHFDDSPQVLEQGAWPVRAGLHLAGNSESMVTFRDGKETDTPSAPAKTANPPIQAAPTQAATAAMPVAMGGAITALAPLRAASGGMNSWGEFGPILGIVLVDAAKGKLAWDRWDNLNGKQAAVFHFAVDRANSHYTVQYCCAREADAVDGSYRPNTGGRRGNGAAAQSSQDKADPALIHQIVGYHGRLTVDPETGSILRITLILELKPEDPIQQGAMMVEYGPVTIGDNSYLCPVRSITASTSSPGYDNGAVSQVKELPLVQVNEVAFTDYHRFGSEATLLTDVASGTESFPEPQSRAGKSSTAVSASTQTAPPAPPAPAPASATPPAAFAAANPPAPAPVPAPPPVAEAQAAEDQELLVHAVEGTPWDKRDSATNAGKGEDFTLRVTTRTVDVSLLALDKHNKPVTDLKPEDIEIYDNGRKQSLQAFRHVGSGTSAQLQSSPAPAVDTDTFTNTAPTMVTIQSAPDLLIILLDESHLPFHDLNWSRDQVLRFIAATRPNARVALYSIGEHGFHVIQDVTQDHPLLIAKLKAWRPTAAAISQAQELDKRDRQQFDTVHSAQDLNSVNGNYTETPDTQQTTDPELRQMGDNPLRQALEGMMTLARHFGPVPGHKSLAWISGDSALADHGDQAVGMEKGPNYLEGVIARTREQLNAAHIALYAVDASQLEGGQIDASLENRNVQLNQAAADNATLGGGTSGRNGASGRDQGQMQQDLRGIQGPVRELAEMTGGRTFRKGADLAASLSSIQQDSDALYEIGFSPDTVADGKFHALVVKVPGRKDLKLRYRSGYLYTEESAGNRERFQQAVWTPQELTGIGLTAQAAPAADKSGPATVNLRITFKDLDFKQDTAGKSPRWTDDLYIFVAQRNDATQKAEVSGDTLRLRLKQATYDSAMPAGIPYSRPVPVSSRLGSVRLIVVDGNSGRMGTITLPASALLP